MIYIFAYTNHYSLELKISEDGGGGPTRAYANKPAWVKPELASRLDLD